MWFMIYKWNYEVYQNTTVSLISASPYKQAGQIWINLSLEINFAEIKSS